MATNPNLQAAYKSIQKRRDELRTLDERRETLLREIAVFEEAALLFDKDGYESDASDTLARFLPFEPSITKRARAAAYEVLSAERPLHRKEVMRRVEAMGVHIEGAKPLQLFGSYIAPYDLIVSVPGEKGVWTLAEDISPENNTNGHLPIE